MKLQVQVFRGLCCFSPQKFRVPCREQFELSIPLIVVMIVMIAIVAILIVAEYNSNCSIHSDDSSSNDIHSHNNKCNLPETLNPKP